MEPNCPDKVMAFDALFTTNHIQMLKILLACVPPSGQKHLAVYIKMLELQYTLTFFQKHPAAKLSFSNTPDNITGVFNEIIPWCSPNEREKLQNFKNFYQNLQNMQEIMQFMEMMQEISPELFSPGTDAESGSPFSGFEDMDIVQMAEMLQAMFSPAAASQAAGDISASP